MCNLYAPVPIEKSHLRSHFECGEESLDNYVRKQVNQDLRRKLCTCFVIVEENEVIGYYTLSSAGISKDLVPEEISKKMPPAYIELPVTLLGRIAVSEKKKGNGLGELLLLDALKRSYLISESWIGFMAVVADPINNSEGFYKKYGFIQLPDSMRMFIPMKTIASLFSLKI